MKGEDSIVDPTALTTFQILQTSQIIQIFPVIEKGAHFISLYHLVSRMIKMRDIIILL